MSWCIGVVIDWGPQVMGWLGPRGGASIGE